MGQAEWMLIVTIGSLVGVGVMGLNLCTAVWRGIAPRPVPVTTCLGVMVLAASVLWTRWDGDETSTLVAAVAADQPICAVSEATASVQQYAGGARLEGSWSGARGCHVWAVIQDPRTGTYWLQGPADMDGSAWSLSVSLATDQATNEQLPYLVGVAALDDDTHEAWLDEALAMGGILSVARVSVSGWLAREILV